MDEIKKSFLIISAICLGVPFLVIALISWKVALAITMFIMLVIGFVAVCALFEDYIE